jgi:dTDP-4-dehydrorhamnose 3,5-epimerase-like enzyme
VAIKKICFSSFVDNRGALMVGQYPDQLPFEPARFFVVSSVPKGTSRGQHAHKSNQQILVCLSGGLTSKFHDGQVWEEFSLKPKGDALFVPPMHFGELYNFLPGTILLVLASEAFDSNEYINVFEEFLTYF